MAIEKGDFIRFNFTGMVESTGDVYNTTIEEIAQEVGVYNEKTVYKPFPCIIGETQLFPELEEAIIGSEVGDKLSVKVPCEHAFGQRDPKLIQLVHIREFKKQGINPHPGMIVQIKGKQGKVLTVNGGRVKVDYNDEYAGKDLVCDIEICDFIEDDDDKVKAIIELNYTNQSFNFDNTKIEWDGDILNITLEPATKFDQDSYMNISVKRYQMVNSIFNSFENIKKVNFIDEYEKPQETNSEEETVENEE